jgi:hypothetical protein
VHFLKRFWGFGLRSHLFSAIANLDAAYLLWKEVEWNIRNQQQFWLFSPYFQED